MAQTTPLAQALSIHGSQSANALKGVDNDLKTRAKKAATGKLIRWGLPFQVNKVHVLTDKSISFKLKKTKANWLCFLHTSGHLPIHQKNVEQVRPKALIGYGNLKELAATYYIIYEDGSEVPYEIRQRYQINTINPPWGENCFDAVAERTPRAMHHDDDIGWGRSQTVHDSCDRPGPDGFQNYICAWKNPHPKKAIVGIRMEPGKNTVVLSGMSACNTTDIPIRWQSRKKMILKVPNPSSLPKKLQADLNREYGHTELMHLSENRNSLIDFDMGTLISAVPRYAYENKNWSKSTFYKAGKRKPYEFIVEYTAHPEATAHIIGGKKVKLADLVKKGKQSGLSVVPPAEQTVLLKVVDKKSKQPVAVRLHIHGQSDEYLCPVDRHRLPNGDWFEDYAPEITEVGMHTSTYIDGRSQIKLPLGKVYLEVSKGFECKPVHKIVNITKNTKEVTIEIEKVLKWREKGWITADTHVHFLSPKTANLEGAAEGVHVVNLLASQWGELMTNAGDFDGKTTFTTTERNEDYLVRVGTENRQHVMGHISLCGYNGDIIAPMCVGGADEAAIGDPVDITLTEWAKNCQKKDGIVVIPHSPNPRAEHAAAVVSGFIDAMEIPSFEIAITPYQLVNWYRYLNCGFQVPLTGGTDKMWAGMEIGRIRAYSKIGRSKKLSYDAWKESMRSGNTFVTFGPLIEFNVDGKEAGSRIKMKKGGGKVTATWEVETVKYELTAVDLIVNGEIVAGKGIRNNSGKGYFEVNVDRSSWFCLLVRGKDINGREVILAHTSSVMIDVTGTEFFAAADAISILDQIEGSMAYLDNIGTRADQKRYKEMRLILEGAHKVIHDRLHKLGHDHHHAPGHHKH